MTAEDLRKIDEELREHYSPHPLPPGGHVDLMDGLERTGVWEDDVFVPNPEPEILERDE